MAEEPETQEQPEQANPVALGDEEGATATEPAPRRKRREDPGGHVWGTGRRKSATARVRIKPGSGRIMVNGKRLEQYFPQLRDQNDIQEPLQLAKAEGQFDVLVKVEGGGFTAQAGAVRLGLARALSKRDETVEQTLRGKDLLTRDPRQKERKKPGQPAARSQFQFSKR
jgi:small subunit ribosomal protein S9